MNEDIAKATENFPDNLGIEQRFRHTKYGIETMPLVISHRGTKNRRIGTITDLDTKMFIPIGDVPFGLVDQLVRLGWGIPPRDEDT